MMVVVGAGTGRRGTCPYLDIDLADPAFWRRPDATSGEAAFARLRRAADAGVLRGAAGERAGGCRLPRAGPAPRRGGRQPQAGGVHQRPGRHHAASRPAGCGSCSATRWSTWTTRGTPGCAAWCRRRSRRGSSPGSPTTCARWRPGSSTTSLRRAAGDFVEAVAGADAVRGHLRHDGHPRERTGRRCWRSSNHDHRARRRAAAALAAAARAAACAPWPGCTGWWRGSGGSAAASPPTT